MSLSRLLFVSAVSVLGLACGAPSDPLIGEGTPAPTSGGSGGGSTTPSPSSGGSTPSGSGGTSSVSSAPVDCSKISDAGFEVCSSSATSCAAVFTKAEGCAEVCAAAGLTCSAVYENATDGCAADMSRPALSCAGTGHDSDYCVCGGSGTTTGSAGSGSGGSSSTGSGGTGGTSSNPTTCSSISDFGTVDSTIVVHSGETYDGGCQRFKAGSSLGDGSQAEGQDPVFVLEDGATLKNVVLGFPAADGIHVQGDVNLYNVHWEDIGEDALTIEESGTVVIDGGSAYKGSDKVFQINAPSTFKVSNFVADGAGKFARQNGGTTFEVNVFIDKCDISNMSESIFRTDSSSSTVSMTNTRYSNIGDQLFIGVSSGNISESNNTEY